MSTHNSLSLRCNHCGEVFTAEAYSLIHVGTEPELKGSVRDGSLFVKECPYCGAHNLVRQPLIYHDPEEKLMIWLLPEGEIASGRIQALETALLAEADSLKGYTLRRVGDIGSLIEKVNIHEAGLDDRVMEMCKYVSQMELAEKDEAHALELSEAPFKFYRMEGADNTLIFSYPLEGRMQGAEVGFHVYEDCRGILQRNPSVQTPAGFARIDAAWLRQYFR